QSAVPFIGLFLAFVAGNISFGELRNLCPSFPYGLHPEITGQRIDGLRTDAVQPDALLKRLAVVLSTRVYPAHTLDHLAERNAATVITHIHLAVADIYLDGLSITH